jgi:hypothetical protein
MLDSTTIILTYRLANGKGKKIHHYSNELGHDMFTERGIILWSAVIAIDILMYLHIRGNSW